MRARPPGDRARLAILGHPLDIYEIDVPGPDYHASLRRFMKQTYQGASETVLEHLDSFEAFLDVCICSGYSLGATKSLDTLMQPSLQALGGICEVARGLKPASITVMSSRSGAASLTCHHFADSSAHSGGFTNISRKRCRRSCFTSAHLSRRTLFSHQREQLRANERFRTCPVAAFASPPST
ncbi:hypothetical protein N9L68_08470 [bacterium]|nr:hypothetical protein [bacterium]